MLRRNNAKETARKTIGFGEMMETYEKTQITICTAPPGLYAVVKNTEKPMDSDARHIMRAVTAFRYTIHEGRPGEVFSEPLVCTDSKNANALVAGSLTIEFVGSREDCESKIKEFVSAYYTEKETKKTAEQDNLDSEQRSKE